MPNTIPLPTIVQQISDNSRRIHFGIGVDNQSRSSIDFNNRQIKGSNGAVIMSWVSGKMVGDATGLSGIASGSSAPESDSFIDSLIFG